MLLMAKVESKTVDDTPVARALDRMRACALRAHHDAVTLVGPLGEQARQRKELFAYSAADLAGTTIEEELERASGDGPPPVWQLTRPDRS